MLLIESISSTDAKLAEVVLSHHVEVATLGQHCRVMRTTLDLLDEDVETATLRSEVEARLRLPIVSTAVDFEAKLSTQVASPNEDLCVEVLAVICMLRLFALFRPLPRATDLAEFVQLSLLLVQYLVVDIDLVL